MWDKRLQVKNIWVSKHRGRNVWYRKSLQGRSQAWVFDRDHETCLGDLASERSGALAIVIRNANRRCYYDCVALNKIEVLGCIQDELPADGFVSDKAG